MIPGNLENHEHTWGRAHGHERSDTALFSVLETLQKREAKAKAVL